MHMTLDTERLVNSVPLPLGKNNVYTCIDNNIVVSLIRSIKHFNSKRIAAAAILYELLNLVSDWL